MTTLTCDHCDSEIDVAEDPKCLFYEPSGATQVMCVGCRERAYDEQVFEHWAPNRIKPETGKRDNE